MMTDAVQVEMWKTVGLVVVGITGIANIVLTAKASAKLSKVEKATDGALTASQATAEAQKIANDRLRDTNHQLALIIAASPGKELPLAPPIQVVANGVVQDGPALVVPETPAEEIVLEAPVSLTVTASGMTPDG